MRILSVDDDPSTTGLLSVILRGGGHTFFSAHSAEEALAILDREPVDLLISDFCLPDMEGLAWLKTVRTRPGCEALPIILCSGGDYARQLTGLGGITPMPKPFNLGQLLEQVRAAAKAGA